MNTSLSHPLSRRSALVGLGMSGLGLAANVPGRSSAQESTPAAISTTLDVIYGNIDGTALLLDVYQPTSANASRPAVVVFYPGGMMAGDKSWMADTGTGLAEAGYVAIIPNYRLFDGMSLNLWPVQLDDAQRAIRWVRANAATYGIDPDRIASYGHSAGAQLAAFLGTRDTRDDSDPELAGISSRVACVIDLAGTMDLTIPDDDPELELSRIHLLGGTPESPPDPAAYADFSPITFVDKTTAPFLILQGGADSVTNLANSRAMEAKLRETGIQLVYAEMPELDHFAWDWAHSSLWTLAFLASLLPVGE